MFNLKKIWKFRRYIFIDVFVLTILFNLLFFAFFFERTYESVSISTEVITSKKAKVWYVYKEIYSEKRFFSEKEELVAKKDNTVKFDIPSNAPLDYIGLYWESEKGSSIKIKSYSYYINSDSYKNKQDRKIIEYVSKGSDVESIIDGVKVTSLSSNINWIMLNDTHRINNRRAKKTHNPIPLWGNLLIVIILICFRSLEPENTLVGNLKQFRIDGPRVRQILLSIWIFIMPFWIIVSHTMMAIIAISTLVSGIRNGELGSLFKGKKGYYFFYAFYVWAVISAIFTSSVAETLDLAVDYSYFLFMPIIFSFVEKKRLTNLFTFLQKGLQAYFILLIIYVSARYFKMDHELSFIKFLKLNVEVFWHTSYLSFLILILFIKNLKTPLKKNIPLLLFYIAALFFMYLIDARMPFLVGSLLLFYKILGIMGSIWVKLFLATVAVLLSVILLGFFLIRDQGGLNVSTNPNMAKLDARFSLWSAGIEQSKKNFIFGVGRKNTVDSIAKGMKGEIDTKYRSYNLHNQFLETMLGNGFLAFVLFLGIFYSLYHRKINYSFSFALSCILLFMVESYFSHQAGIILFTFWACFFLRYDVNQNVDEIDPMRLGNNKNTKLSISSNSETLN